MSDPFWSISSFAHHFRNSTTTKTCSCVTGRRFKFGTYSAFASFFSVARSFGNFIVSQTRQKLIKMSRVNDNEEGLTNLFYLVFCASIKLIGHGVQRTTTRARHARLERMKWGAAQKQIKFRSQLIHKVVGTEPHTHKHTATQGEWEKQHSSSIEGVGETTMEW